MVQKLPPTRFCAVWQSRLLHRDPSPGHSDSPEPFPHNEEPLGLTTVMRKGVPILENLHRLCELGKVLTAEQAQLLKLIGEKMVVFRVGLRARWDSATGEVKDVTDPGVWLDVHADADADAGRDGRRRRRQSYK